MAATLGIPAIDGREAALVDELLKLREADSLKFDRGAGLRHGGPLDCFRAPLKAGVFAMSERTAIVTGAGKRVGAEIASALAQRAGLHSSIPIGGDDVLIKNPLGHQRRFAFASGDFSRAAGDAQSLQGHWNQDGHKNKGREDFGKSEGGLACGEGIVPC